MALSLRVTLQDILIPKTLKVSNLECEVSYRHNSYLLERHKPIKLELASLRSKIEFILTSDGIPSGHYLLDLSSFFDYESTRSEIFALAEHPNHSFSIAPPNSPIQIEVSLSLQQTEEDNLDSLVSALHSQITENRTIMDENEKLKELLEKSYESRNELQILVKESTDQMTSQISVLDTKLKSIIQERDDLTRKAQNQANSEELLEEIWKLKENIMKASTEREGCLQEISKLRYENSCLSSQIATNESQRAEILCNLQKQKEITKSLRTEKEDLLKVIQSLRENAENDHEKMSLLQSEKTAIQSQLINAHKKLGQFKPNNIEEENSKLKELLAQTQEKLIEKTSEADQLFREREEAYTEISKIEQYLCVTEDIQQIVDDLREQNKASQLSKTKLMDELSSMSDIISLQSKRNQASNAKIKKLSEELFLTSEHSKRGYIPVRDDPIDQALAGVVNNRAEFAHLRFLREEEGVYLFGSRRVFVKLEHGHLVCRVGGGYMMIEDFLNTYLPLEIDRKLNESARSNDSTGARSSDRKPKTGRDKLPNQCSPSLVSDRRSVSPYVPGMIKKNSSARYFLNS